jgi:hypothetical protein
MQRQLSCLYLTPAAPDVLAQLLRVSIHENLFKTYQVSAF